MVARIYETYPLTSDDLHDGPIFLDEHASARLEKIIAKCKKDPKIPVVRLKIRFN